MGRFKKGMYLCVPGEKAPLLLTEMLPVPGRASAGASVLRCAIVAGDLNDDKNGSVQFLASGVDLRAAAPVAVVFFAVRGPAEIARRAASDFDGDEEKGVVNISAARQKNDKLGMGQTAYLASISA